jgi:hypothetical protein
LMLVFVGIGCTVPCMVWNVYHGRNSKTNI